MDTGVDKRRELPIVGTKTDTRDVLAHSRRYADKHGLDKTLVVVKGENIRIETGLKKMGAMLGDNVEVGCNSVLNPGTVIGRNSNVYPTSCVRGVIPAGHIFKRPGEVVKKSDI